MKLRLSPLWSDPRVKPPFGAAEIDHSHPLASGLTLALPFNEGAQDKIRPLYSLYGIAPISRDPTVTSWVPTVRGPALRCLSDATGSAVSFGALDSVLMPHATEFTALLHYSKTDGSNRSSSAFGVENWDERCQVHLPWSDGVVYWDWGGPPFDTSAQEGSTRLSVGGLSFGDDVWAFTTGYAGMQIWQNGVRVASNGSTPARTITSSNVNLFGATSQADLAECAFLFFWAKQVREIPWLTAEPFAMFRPIVRRRYFVPVAAGPTTAQMAGAFVQQQRAQALGAIYV